MKEEEDVIFGPLFDQIHIFSIISIFEINSRLPVPIRIKQDLIRKKL